MEVNGRERKFTSAPFATADKTMDNRILVHTIGEYCIWGLLIYWVRLGLTN